MRVYNFSAGPSCLPEAVLQKVQHELIDYQGSGQSVMEMSHRSVVFENIIAETEQHVRTLLHIPQNYRVLFLQGGASTQFAMVPLNLKKLVKAAYVNTGVWSKKAIAEAKKYLSVDVVASSEAVNFTEIPTVDRIDGEYDYAHITLNNTIMGTRWGTLPAMGTRKDGSTIPLVADISSCILSEPLDVTQFGLLYAGAQKNLAPAGVTLVIIREDLISQELADICPTMLQYAIHANSESMYNTPPCWCIYVMNEVLLWIKSNGGAEGMQKRNQEKAQLFYDFLDNNDFYYGTVQKQSRSLMNIPFLTKEKDAEKAKKLNTLFVSQAAEQGLINLAGHRLVGGMRASIYNAMEKEGVQALINFMQDFAKKQG